MIFATLFAITTLGFVSYRSLRNDMDRQAEDISELQESRESTNERMTQLQAQADDIAATVRNLDRIKTLKELNPSVFDDTHQ